MQTFDIFVYGTLLDSGVRRHALGRELALTPATLAHYQRVYVLGKSYPGLAPQAGGRVEGGLMTGLSDALLERLLHFESDEYTLTVATVRLPERAVSAHLFMPGDGVILSDEVWTLDEWRQSRKKAFLESDRF